MILKLTRREFHPEKTIGDLSIDGFLYCNTLEDTVRPPGVKIPGQTAIPAGRYEVRLTYSQRFKQVMPQLMNVPGFDGIRIHSGNTDKDTAGCLLVGKYDPDSDTLVNSLDTYNDLMDELERTKEPMFVIIQ